MKRLLSLFFCIPFVVLHAQNDLFGSSSISNSTSIIMDARDISGKPIPSGAQSPVQGSPMITDEFVNGVVKFKGDEATYNLMLGFSLFDNQLYFRKDNITLKFVNPIDNFSLILKDKEATKIMNFKSGYPTVGNNDEGTFYQILLDGPKVQLLKYLYKSVREKYTYGGPTEKEYVEKERLFVYDIASKMITEVTPNVNSIEKALPNYAASIEKLASQIKVKHEEEIIALLTAINNEPTKKELKTMNK